MLLADFNVKVEFFGDNFNHKEKIEVVLSFPIYLGEGTDIVKYDLIDKKLWDEFETYNW